MSLVCVVIPTRNRPSFLRAALNSLVNQSDHDFSVVVSDNSDDDESGRVCREFSNKLKLRYQRTDRTLSMVDNWNFGLSGAHAEFVAVMIDKTVWNPSVVRTVRKTVQDFGNVDVMSWGSEDYHGENEGTAIGRYVPTQGAREPVKRISLLGELLERRQFKMPRGARTSNSYCLGKICFGIYSTSLIQRIQRRHGYVFHPLSPDYSSMTLASCYSTSAVQLGVPMQLSFVTSLSNGSRAKKSPVHALEYLSAVDPQLSFLSRLPIPGLYQSQENCCAFDLIQFDEVFDVSLKPPNLGNLRKLVSAEVWNSRQEIDSSFLCEQDLRDLTKSMSCLSTKRRMQQLLHPSRNTAALKVRSSEFVYRVHRLLQKAPGIQRVLHMDTSRYCPSPEAALQIQMQMNRERSS